MAERLVVLFVDLVGSTSLAESAEPKELVPLLNAFFDIVIDVVYAYEGWINKFQGDAALATWGAPLSVDEVATKSWLLRGSWGSGFEKNYRRWLQGSGFGGTVVTGNIGAARRYEYTAIGDPVNEAARLTETAKSQPGGVVANADPIEMATSQERSPWVEVDPVVLRGRSSRTRVAVPGSGDRTPAGLCVLP